MKDVQVASDGFTVATGATGSFVVNQGFQTVGGARTFDLSAGNSNSFTFQSVAPGNTTAGKLTLRLSSTVDGAGAQFNTADAFGITPDAEIVLNASSAGGTQTNGTRLTINNVSMATGVSLRMEANASPNNRSTLRGLGVAAWEGAIQLSGSGITQLDAATVNGSLSVHGNIDSGTNTTTLLIRGAGSGNLNGVVGGSTALQKADTGTWRINHEANTFTGSAQAGAGILQVTKLANGGQDSSLGRASTAIEFGTGNTNDNAVIEYAGTSASSTDRGLNLRAGSGPSTFTVRANGTTVAASVAFTGNVTTAVINTTRTLVLDGSNAGDNTISGVIQAPTSGTVNVTKAGTGTWVLGGNNTYNGTTTVTAGTLVVNGTHAGTGAVTVSGGTLGGTGTLAGAVTVNTAGTLEAGSGGVGTLTVNNNLTVNGTLRAEVGASAADQLNLSGGSHTLTLAANSTLTLAANGYDGSTSSYRLADLNGTGSLLSIGGTQYAAESTIATFTSTGGSTGSDDNPNLTFNLTNFNLNSGDTITLRRDSFGDLVITFTPVPEPAGVLLLVGLAGAGVAGWRRLRRKSPAGGVE